MLYRSYKVLYGTRYYWLGRTQASRPPSIPRRSTMAKYLISFPSAAMVVPDGECGAVGRDAHAVIDQAKASGVYVFGGGIDEDVPPILVSADGAVAMGGYPWAPTLTAASPCWNCLRALRPSRGRRDRQGLSLRPRTARLRVRPAVLRAALKWRGKCGLTIHSSRTRFAGRLNSGVGLTRPKSVC